MPLPPAPYDACDKRPGRASSLSLVRYRSNDYSVPVAYGHREVLIRGYVDEVVISCGAEVIARHRRSYDSEDLIFDPLHYLPLIEQKIGALDQAAPLAGWDLPEAFITLRRLLEARMGKAGKREYVQVLRLLETFRLEEVEGAVGDALRLGAIGFDAVKHLVLCRIERPPPRLNLDVYPYLRRPGRDDVRQVVHEPAVGARRMTDTPQVLLVHHLKTLKLPTFLREYDKIARQCASEGVDHVRYLLRLAELELIDRERRMVERRIKAARFPWSRASTASTSRSSPRSTRRWSWSWPAASTSSAARTSSRSATVGPARPTSPSVLGLAACQKGLSVGFITAAALVHELIEARDDKQLLRFQKKLATYKLLIVDELGFVPLSKTGAELLFEVFSQRYERGSTLVTTNLPFDEWTEVFGSERLTGALLDRLTHHVNILEMNGDSYRLNQSRRRQTPTAN